jgi:hypothetical protein
MEDFEMHILRSFAIVGSVIFSAFAFSVTLDGTLYDNYMKPYREKVISGDADILPGTRVYEHLNISRSVEMERYIAYSKDLNPVKTLMDDFLIRSSIVEKDKLSDLLEQIASRDVGKLLIQLLLTKMSVRREFWTRVATEVSVRKKALEDALCGFKGDQVTALPLLSAYYSVSNILEFLTKPNAGDSTIAIDNVYCTSKIANKFSFDPGCENSIESFYQKIKTEAPLDKSLVGNIIIKTKTETNIALKLLQDLGAMAANLIDKSSKIEILKGKNGFTPGTVATYPSIMINFDAYNENGIAIHGGHYCYTRKYYTATNKKNVGMQQKTIFGSGFHEFDHSLHFLEGRMNFLDGVVKVGHDSLDNMYDTEVDDAEFGIRRWTDDEEFLNISGLFYNGTNWCVDPVSCAAFCRQEAGHNSAPRCFHKTPAKTLIGASTAPDDIPLSSSEKDIEKLEKFIVAIYS